jgi:hypothetical protein
MLRLLPDAGARRFDGVKDDGANAAAEAIETAAIVRLNFMVVC